MNPPINPDKDFAGFVEERLNAARLDAAMGLAAIGSPLCATGDQPSPDIERIDQVERMARYFTRAASEINAIAKAIKRKHGITAEDEHQRWCESMKKRRADG